MPVTRKPVVHKFGIISHSQRLQLQERLLHQTYLDACSQPSLINRNPVEISEQFVSQYNNARSPEERDKVDGQARKLLERIKRKCGLKDGGQGSHVDLPFAWTDLCLLAQCKGHIQEDCLDVFVSSLEQAPLTAQHVPVLFYLGETCLYWLRTDAVKQPYLRASEIKLLRMGELVFLALFYHHMAGHLETHGPAKRRLFTYLDGLQECQEVYNPYPNALFSLRYINQVGSILVSDVIAEVGDMAEQSDEAEPRPSDDATPRLTSQALEPGRPSSAAEREAAHEDVLSRGGAAEREAAHEDVLSRGGAAEPPERAGAGPARDTLSRSVHELSPSLWHALDVWRCTHQLGAGLTEALAATAVCARNINKENWIDGVLALRILAEAARTDAAVLGTLLQLARGVSTKPKLGKLTKLAASDKTSGVSPGRQESPPTLSDIQERSESRSTAFDVLSHNSRPTNPVSLRSKPAAAVTMPSTSSSGHNQSAGGLESLEIRDKSDNDYVSPLKDERQSEASLKSDRNEFGNISDEMAPDLKSNRDQSIDVIQTETVSSPDGVTVAPPDSVSVAPPDGGFVSDHMCAAAWAELTSSERAESPASSVNTFTNKVCEQAGVHGWHWEVAVTLAELLTELVLHGATSSIQKRALLGSHQDLPLRHQAHAAPMRSCGLLDLVNFKAAAETSDLGPNDWSWRVRYSAIQGLVKICRLLEHNTAREGTRTAAWTVLSRVRTQEQDARVLEALKVGQVEVTITGSKAPRASALPGQIAARLAAIYLPPLPPVVPHVTPRRKPSPARRGQPPSYKRDPKSIRTTLTAEVGLATAFERKFPDLRTRADLDLRRVLEDQWRKQVQSELTEEEAVRRQVLDERQAESGAEQRDRKLGPDGSGGSQGGHTLRLS